MTVTSVAGPDVERFFIEPADWVEEVGKVKEELTKFGMHFYAKDMSAGEPDDGPWARLVWFPAGFENNPHFHSAPQFQVVVTGSVSFPTHELKAPAVHYADAFSPYGPFTVGENFTIMVVRPWRARKYNMSARETRGLRNPYGRNKYGQQRELYGELDDAAWGERDGDQSQQLLGTPTEDGLDGPMAELVRLPAGGSIINDPLVTEHGLFVIVFEGAVTVGEKTMAPSSTYFARGEHRTPFVAGAEGALLLRLAYDDVADLAEHAGPTMSQSEIEVADSAAIGEGDVIAFDVDGRDIAVARSGAKLYAFDDCCTHEECPLSTGWLEGTEIECDRHGARFDFETGAVTLPPAFAPLQTHRVSERDGRVFVTLASTPATAE